MSLLLAEGLVRLVAPQSLIQIRPDIWMPSPDVGWRHRPDVDTRINTGEREVRWRTDGRGFRIGAQAPPPSQVNLLALGDSFLSAMQVEDEETFVRLLEERLSARSGRRVRLWNAGVEGWGPNQYRNELKRVLDSASIDGVIVVVFLGNDVEKAVVESYPPKVPEERHELRWPRGLGKDELVKAVAYPINDFFEVRSHLFILLKTRLKYLLMRLGLTAYYFPETLLTSQASSPRWGTTAGILESLAERASARGLHTIFLLIPSPEEADPAQASATAKAFGIDPATFDVDQPHVRLREEMERRGLTVFDATPALRSATAEGRPDVYGTVDNHLGKTGHRIVEDVLEDPSFRAFLAAAPPAPAARPSRR